jgi:hypothetical protein
MNRGQFIVALLVGIWTGALHAVEASFHSSCDGEEEYYVKRSGDVLTIEINGVAENISITDQLTSISEVLRAGRNIIKVSYNRDMDDVNISFIHECDGERERIFHRTTKGKESERPSVSVNGRVSVSLAINTNVSTNHVEHLEEADKEEIKEVLRERFKLISESRFKEAYNLCHEIKVNAKEEFPGLNKEMLDYVVEMANSGEGGTGLMDPDGRIVQDLVIDNLSYIVTPSLVIVHRPNNDPLYSIGMEGGGETRVQTERFQKKSGEWVCLERKLIQGTGNIKRQERD